MARENLIKPTDRHEGMMRQVQQRPVRGNMRGNEGKGLALSYIRTRAETIGVSTKCSSPRRLLLLHT